MKNKMNSILRIILIINLIVVVSIILINCFFNEAEFHYNSIMTGIILLINIVLLINLLGHKDNDNKRVCVANVLITIICLIIMFGFPVCYIKSRPSNIMEDGEIRYLPYYTCKYFNCYNIRIK